MPGKSDESDDKPRKSRKKRKRVDPDQQSMDFASQQNERLAQIRSLRNVLTDWSPQRADGVVELLERIVLCSNDHLTSYARVCALAARIDKRKAVSEKTIRNWKRDAVALGVLDADIRSHRFGGHTPNAWAIQLDRLRELTGGGNGAVMGRKLAGNGAVTISAPGAVTISAPGAVTISALTVGSYESSNEPPPSAYAATEWEEAAEILRDLKVGAWRAVIDGARRRGLNEAKLVQQIEIGRATIGLRANAKLFTDPGGALFWFLQEGDWPCKGVVTPEEQQRRDAAAQDKQREEQAEAEQAANAKLAEQARKVLLEREYGPWLDAMDANELLQLAREAFADERKKFHLDRFLRNGLAPTIRELLLKYLAELENP